jgi:hypothetical protein
MTTTTEKTLTRPAELLLLRLLPQAKKPTAPARLRQELGRLFREPLSANRWSAIVEELAAAGLLTVKPLRLTPVGRVHGLGLLGLQALPERLTWRALRDRYLVPRALGVPPEAADTRSRIATQDGLGAWLLKRRYNLPTGSGQTVNAALEALACRELGFAGETSLEAVRDEVLSRLLKAPERLNREQLTRQMVQSVAKARRADLAGLREATLSDWLDNSDGAQPPGANWVPGEAEAFDLAAFAATVQAAARGCPTGRFGDNKVFIHRVWGVLRDEPGLPVRSLDEFKRRLADANHAGLLQLSRADLVQAMDPADVAAAETRYLDASFHFVLVGRDRP